MEPYASLARYNRWMNERLYAASATLPDEARKRDLRAFFRSLHGTLNHLVLTDRIWLARFTGDAERFTSRDAAGQTIPFRGHGQELYADFEVLRRERAATDEEIVGWADGLDAGTAAGPFVYANLSGQRCEHPLWWAAQHFFNHQTHHRGQATTLLFQLGVDPGVTDFIAWRRLA